MPKFKPKKILSRVILGKSKQEEGDRDYLHAGFETYFSKSQSHEHNGRTVDDVDDDASSAHSFSTTATANDLPGAGRSVDTYFYQPIGRWVEKLGKRTTSPLPGNDDIGDDVVSISSCSTTATEDNIPGTGRSIDMHFYQPAGRWIERFAMRFTISSLHPARITQYIEADGADYEPAFLDSWTLNVAVAWYCDMFSNGTTVIAGVKALVKQTQSNSIYKSASALAALIRVSLSAVLREVYVNLSCEDYISNLENLAGSLARSHPEKKYFLLLARLARETLIGVKVPTTQMLLDPFSGSTVEQLWPSSDQAQSLRQRLIQVLELYRVSGLDSPDDILGEACAICAEATSTYINAHARGDAYLHILGTVYFTVVFILRSIHELAISSRLTANRHVFMVLRTIMSWIDAIVLWCLYAVDSSENIFDMNLLELGSVFRSLVLALRSEETAQSLLPVSFEFTIDNALIDKPMLPRRLRLAADRGEENPIIQHHMRASLRRTRRLLSSPSELEREVWGSSKEVHSFTLQLMANSAPFWVFPDNFGENWWANWECTLARGRRVQVETNGLTEDFVEARRIGLERDPLKGPDDGLQRQVDYDKRNWPHYSLYRIARKEWGRYFSSNMDWEWDLGMCMNHLFEVEVDTS